jgi:homoserine dehydrogenase
VSCLTILQTIIVEKEKYIFYYILDMALKLRIGLFGGGVVGGGVYELVQKYSHRFAQLGANVEIVKICVRSLDKPRDYKISPSTTFVTNYEDILNDSSINCVVELMGGNNFA